MEGLDSENQKVRTPIEKINFYFLANFRDDFVYDDSAYRGAQ
jgi:hypothetical protein